MTIKYSQYGRLETVTNLFVSRSTHWPSYEEIEVHTTETMTSTDTLYDPVIPSKQISAMVYDD
jgi:hypothetical protein